MQMDRDTPPSPPRNEGDPMTELIIALARAAARHDHDDETAQRKHWQDPPCGA